MSRDPTTAATTSLKETVTLSSSGKRPRRRNSKPPTRAPTKPSPRLRKTPKPLRSRVIISPARLPPSRPMIIQTMNWSSETITALPRFGEAEAVGSVFEFISPDSTRAGHNKPFFAPGAGPAVQAGREHPRGLRLQRALPLLGRREAGQRNVSIPPRLSFRPRHHRPPPPFPPHISCH